MRVAISAAILTVFILGSGLSTADTDRSVKRQSRKINCQALVIGNAEYSGSPLTNPVNDASDMASALRRLGFNVIVKTNADHRQMDTAIREFGKILPRSDIGLFYFAGHGMQIKGKNYLIPINNNIHDETDVKFEALDAERILARMEGAGTAMNIVILDACRDNPFKRSFRSSGSGLARMDAPPGTIIAYATSPDSVAADGRGRNGTYTAALLKNINRPGLDVQRMFNQAGLEVMYQTNKAQVPWLSTTPIPEYYLAGGNPEDIRPVPSYNPVYNTPPVVATPQAANDTPGPGSTFTDPVTGMEFVWVPGGCYQMGSQPSEKDREGDEGPVHEVCVDGFWMGKYEVTNRQYRKFKPSHSSKDYNGVSLNGDDQPAVYVSWNDARAFISWLNEKTGKTFSLPTEAQWEYACRAGTGTIRYWGDGEDEACAYANVHDETSKRVFKFDWTHHSCNDGYAGTSPVGGFKPNKFGLYDMLGNVWEWCADGYDSEAYSKHGRNDPFVSNGSNRVLRGGSWNGNPGFVRCANRLGIVPSLANFVFGFRLVLSGHK